MQVFRSIDLTGFGEKYSGKVRDYYTVGNDLILITTDRISAFDRILGFIPSKGQVLNLLSAFWFEKTADIVPNHLIAIPDPNVTVAKKAQPIPLEMVVRGYITGVTGTSIWGSYEKGDRLIYGLAFSDGLRKNQRLPQPIITPTTKAPSAPLGASAGHDERLTREEILQRKILPEKTYIEMEEIARALFQRGAEICDKSGIILVDTKYEFGLLDGKVILIDEIHTPDSSRFWIKKTYQERFENGEEPENFDKEFVRLWFKDHGYTGEGEPPTMPDDLIEKVSKRYIDIYEKITKKKFVKATGDIVARIKKNLKKYEN